MKKLLWISLSCLGVFILWTALVGIVDVQAIGPNGSAVGFATVNGFFHRLTGVHMDLYVITDWLGLVPIGVTVGFAILGMAQWISRRDIRKVDFDIILLGGFYIITFFLYMLFEVVVINRRPILIEGFLEASYPSSTTLLVLCVMPTALLQAHTRIKKRGLRLATELTALGFIGFMVIGRLICGVHWLSDIVGGILLSAGLVLFYAFLYKKTPKP
jgi:undecaprenyl-diphosphatase